MTYGTLTHFDTLATAWNTTVAAFGEDRAWEAISESLAAHNQQLNDSMAEFVETSTDRQRRYGGSDTMSMEELDEFGTPDAQKISAGASLGFPLRFYGIALQWTRLYFQNAQASELAAQVTAAQDADIKAMQRELKRALFINVAAGTSFVDRRVDGVTLTVRNLLNADSEVIPIAPDGSTFTASSHTHYLLASTTAWSGSPAATAVAATLKALGDHVLEHFLSGQIIIAINKAQEATVRTATGFSAYVDARIIQGGGSTTNIARGSLDTANVSNRAIGITAEGYEVHVKPWVPANYLIAYHVGTGGAVLVRRVRNQGGGNLELLFENETYPLRARALGREFGFGVFNRAGAAVTYVNSTSSWTDPTIT